MVQVQAELRRSFCSSNLDWNFRAGTILSEEGIYRLQ
jgi:hypothetical protein